MQDIDVTNQVRVGGIDGDLMPLEKCVCGEEFDYWDFILKNEKWLVYIIVAFTSITTVLLLTNDTLLGFLRAVLAAGIFASTLPTLLRAGLIRRARHATTREVLLVFPSTLWTDDLKLKANGVPVSEAQ